MKALTYDFSSEDAFKTFAHLLNFSLEHLRQIAADSEVLQARLVLSLIEEVYKQKVLIKLLNEPEHYRVSLKEQEVIAIKLLLTNYDFLEAPNSYTMAILSELNAVIEEYLTNNPVKIKQPCVNLLSNATNEYKLSIEG